MILHQNERTTFTFATQQELEAFLLGISFCTDSALIIESHGPIKPGDLIALDGIKEDGYVAVIFDTDVD